MSTVVAAGIVLAAATAGLSFESLRKAAYTKVVGRGSDTRQEAGTEPAPGSQEPALLDFGQSAIREFRRCGRTASAAAVAAALRRFASVNPAENYENWSRALAGAEQAVTLSLRCAPTNGLRWAQLAVLDRAAASLPDRIVPILDMSGRQAPADGDAIILRLAGWWSLPELSVARSPVRLSDTRLFLANADPATVVSMLREAPAWVSEEARPLYAGLAEQRQRHLKAAGIFASASPEPKNGGYGSLLSTPSPFRP